MVHVLYTYLRDIHIIIRLFSLVVLVKFNIYITRTYIMEECLHSERHIMTKLLHLVYFSLGRPTTYLDMQSLFAVIRTFASI
jgi:hypothetical protein